MIGKRHSKSRVNTTLATMAKATGIRPELTATTNDAATLTKSNRQAASVTEEEFENSPATRKKHSEQSPRSPVVPTTLSFPQYSRDDLVRGQTEYPSIKEFLKHWMAS